MEDAYVRALPNAPSFTVREGTVREADAEAAALGFTPGLSISPSFFDRDANGIIRHTVQGRAYVLRYREIGDVRLCSLFPAQDEPEPLSVLGAFSRASGAIRSALQDLNTALNGIADDLDPANEEALRQNRLALRSLYRLERTAAHMNLFHLLQSGSYPLQRQRCELRALLIPICDEAEYLMKSRDVALTASLPARACFCNIDQHLISLIVWELLDNALANGESPVHMDVRAKSGERMTISVRSKLRTRLPEDPLRRWQNEPDDPREQQRTGMGLSLASAAAKYHGGNLLVSTSEDGVFSASAIIPLPHDADQTLGTIRYDPITSLDLGLTVLSFELPAELYDPLDLF